MDKILFAIGALIVLAIIIIVFLATRTATMAKKCRGRSGFTLNPDGSATLGPNDVVVLSGGTVPSNVIISTQSADGSTIYYGYIVAGNFSVFQTSAASYNTASLATTEPVLVIAIASTGQTAAGYYLDDTGALFITDSTGKTIMSTPSAPSTGSGCYEFGIDLTSGSPQLVVIDSSAGDVGSSSAVLVWSTASILEGKNAGLMTITGGPSIPVVAGMIYQFDETMVGGGSSGDQTPISSPNCLFWAYLDNGQTIAGNPNTGNTGKFIVCQFGTLGEAVNDVNISINTSGSTPTTGGVTYTLVGGILSIINKCGRPIAQIPSSYQTAPANSTIFTIYEGSPYAYASTSISNCDIDISDSITKKLLFSTSYYPRSISGTTTVIPNSSITVYGAITSINSASIVYNPIIYSPSAFMNGSKFGYMMGPVVSAANAGQFFLGVFQSSKPDWSDLVSTIVNGVAQAPKMSCLLHGKYPNGPLNNGFNWGLIPYTGVANAANYGKFFVNDSADGIVLLTKSPIGSTVGDTSTLLLSSGGNLRLANSVGVITPTAGGDSININAAIQSITANGQAAYACLSSVYPSNVYYYDLATITALLCADWSTIDINAILIDASTVVS